MTVGIAESSVPKSLFLIQESSDRGLRGKGIQSSGYIATLPKVRMDGRNYDKQGTRLVICPHGAEFDCWKSKSGFVQATTTETKDPG